MKKLLLSLVSVIIIISTAAAVTYNSDPKIFVEELVQDAIKILKSKKNSVYFTKKNKYKKLFDLRKYVGDKLIKLDVIVDHVNHDTFKEKNNFFSYRRSQKLKEKDYGRCISIVGLI